MYARISNAVLAVWFWVVCVPIMIVASVVLSFFFEDEPKNRDDELSSVVGWSLFALLCAVLWAGVMG